jgi:hypothetical protein
MSTRCPRCPWRRLIPRHNRACRPTTSQPRGRSLPCRTPPAVLKSLLVRPSLVASRCSDRHVPRNPLTRHRTQQGPTKAGPYRRRAGSNHLRQGYGGQEDPAYNYRTPDSGARTPDAGSKDPAYNYSISSRVNASSGSTKYSISRSSSNSSGVGGGGGGGSSAGMRTWR